MNPSFVKKNKINQGADFRNQASEMEYDES